jgi:phthiocerol/phenolphthiocerol synthesis type-I polyketide synthase D
MRTAFSQISGMTGQQRTALADEFDKASRIAVAEPVAVVGIGCRFPGDVAGPESFWRLLVNGEDAITEVPADRWDADAFYDPDPLAPGRMTTKWGGFVSDVAGFDADFFGITPREAEAMDPQQRMLLEVAWEALEHAGTPPDSLAGTRTAVMMGVYYNEYQSASGAAGGEFSPYTATGNAHSVTVGRISYLLGLRGPAVAVDTACSSSLVAVHLACQSLRLRESDLALAGGVNLILRPETQLALSAWGMFSPHGRCRTFDADADGFVRGEGCGVVVLKRLTDAVRDGDRVLAVVRGSAVNQDGRSNGLTAPNALSQRDVIAAALRAGDVAANSVNYIETHGTGTVLGDPIEFDALAATYGRGEGACALGAVKTNLGHLEAAAGIAGFIKATLALRHGQIPPNLNFSRWNPAIDASATRLYVPTGAPVEWAAHPGPRRAAVSSFGFGGTNAHVVLEQGPDPDPAPVRASDPTVTTLVVSGKTPARVASFAGALADWMQNAGADVTLADVAHTLQHHRSRHSRSATVAACDREQAVAALRAVAANQPAVGVVGPHDESHGPGTVFVYSGQGSQYSGMGRELLADEPAFAAAVAELEPVFVAQTGFSVQQVLAAGEPVSGIERIQPVLMGIQLALTALWRSYGVQPDAVIGHSMGEVTAAVVAGALTVAEGLQVIATRSRLMSRLSGQGAMALLELDAAETEALIADHPDVTVAVYASPRQTVIAGPPEQVQAVIDLVQQQNRLARFVDVDVASHHPIIDPVLPELRAALTGLSPRTPTIPLITTTYDHTSGTAPVFDAQHWCDNLRNPVRFTHAIAAAGTDHHTFVEVSPHPLLTHAITDTLGAGHRSIGTLYRDNPEALVFHTHLATVRPPSRDAGPAGTAGRLVDMPTAPWEHRPYWIAERSAGVHPSGAHPLLGTHIEMPSGREHVWHAEVGTDVHPWLAHHTLNGQPIMPAAAFAEIALAAGSEGLGLAVEAVQVNQLEIEQMLPLDSHTEITTRLIRSADNGIRVEVHSRSQNGGWSRHAVARIEVAKRDTAPERLSPIAGTSGTEISVADFYAALRHTGEHHGPAFAALTRIVRQPTGLSETEIVLPEEAPRHSGYRVHPVMLDAALQSVAAAVPAESIPDSADVAYLPVSFDTIRVFGEVGRRSRCRAELVSLDEAGAGKLGRVWLLNEAGDTTAEITGIYVQRIDRGTAPQSLAHKIFDTVWIEKPIPAGTAVSGPPPGSWLLLPEHPDITALADEVGAGLQSASRRVITASLGDESAVLDAFADAGAVPEQPPVGVVVFVGHDSFDGAHSEGALARTREAIWSVLAAVRAVVRGWHGQPPRLWLVTRDGLTVRDDEPGDPAIGALRGLIRVLAYEHPDLRATLVDLDTAADAAEVLNAELGSADPDDVIAWRGERRYVERLSRGTLRIGERAPVVRSEASYILTGGLGGLGLVVARWLVERGAGRIVLNGRHEPSEEQRSILAELESRADIAVACGDIAAPGVAERLVAAAEATGLPLRGVIHSAAVIDDELILAISRDALERVWAPKAAGAVRLHEATADRELDWWLGFSSVASLLGSPGQAAYACANAWLDALVSWRRAAGLPATTIRWGQWAEVGVARSLTMSALDPITPAEGIEALEALLAAGVTRMGVARLRLDRALAAFPEIRELGYFARVVEELDDLAAGRDWPGPEALRDLDPAEAQRMVGDRLRGNIVAIMGYADESALDPDLPLIELGMDSLMAVRIRNTARADFGVEPSVALLLQGASLRALTADIVGQLGLSETGAAERTDGVRHRPHLRAAAPRTRDAAETVTSQSDTAEGETAAGVHIAAEANSGAEGDTATEVASVELDAVQTSGGVSGSPAVVAGGPSSSASDPAVANAIAVVGMAGRFPGAPSVSAFWDNLRRAEESIVTLSEEELTAAGIGSKALANPAYVRRAAILDGIDEFDAAFFGFPPQAARMMDPQHRLFLQCSGHALEDAGCDPGRFDGSIGVYGTSTASGYLLHNLMSHLDPNAIIGQGATFEMIQLSLQNDKDHLATRVSHQFNLRGPAISVQTACSSSLVAVHLACRSILSGECDMALAGGASIRVPHRVGYWHEPGSMVSATGHCRPFDVRADGTIFGSGVAVVVLKPLQAALDDGDRIHAVIRGSAINNDGAMKMNYAAPNPAAQAEVIAVAHAVAGVDASTISYVETHGTGTPLGDPIEIDGLRKAFALAKADRAGPCVVGSVKSNIGHLEVASGITGLVKTILCLKNRAIPATLHFTRPNPELHLEHGPFVVPSEYTPWEWDGVRRAGVSSFGVGGTNAHVVLEEAPPFPAPAIGAGPQVLVLSAKSTTALQESRAALAAALSCPDELNLSDVAYTLAGRRTENVRLAAVVNDTQQATTVLGATEHDNVFVGEYPDGPAASPPRVVFLFPGQGAQHEGMARGLYETEPVFAAHFEECAAGFLNESGIDLFAEVFDRVGSTLERTELAQPALFAVEYALAKLLESYGVQAAALAGHSIGEYVAATLAGVFDLPTAIKTVSVRARLMHSSAPGVMVAVAQGPDAIAEYLSPDVDLAAVNDPGNCVVAGSEQSIRAFQKRLAENGIPARRMRTSHAFHSRAMEPVLAEFGRFLNRTTLREPQIPLLANLTGTWMSADEAVDRATWVRQIRATVRFSEELDVLLAEPRRVLVEVGPGGALTASAMRHPKWSDGHRAVRLMRHQAQNRSDRDAFLLGLGQLWSAGIDVDWTPLSDGHRPRPVSLPGYPFERQRHWVDPKPSAEPAEGTSAIKGVVAPSSNGDGGHPDAAKHGQVPMEAALQRIWAQCLGVASIDRSANFFELGGDSLIAIGVAMTAANEGLDLTPQDLYEYPSVAALAGALTARYAAGGLGAQPPSDVVNPPVPPNIAYFLDRGVRDAGRWQIPLVLRLRSDVGMEDVRAVLTAVANHHDALRAQIVERAGTWKQHVADPQEFTQLARRSLPGDADPASAREREALLAVLAEQMRGHELSSTPLAATYVRGVPGGPCYLAISVHATVGDDASRDILATDIFTAFAQRLAGEEITLQPVTTTWREWSQRCAALATHAAVLESLDFWLDYAARATLRVADQAITEPPSADDLARLSSALTVAQTTEVDHARRELRLPIDELLLAALGRTIAATIGTGAVAVDLAGAGRSLLKPDVDLRRSVGWFTTIYPVPLTCATGRDAGARQLLDDVHDTVRAVPHYGIGYGLLRYVYAPTARALSTQPPPDIFLSYVGTIPELPASDAPVQFDTDTALPVREAIPGMGHAVEVRVYRAAGALHVDWWYDTRRLRRGDAEALAQHFPVALIELIREAIGVTDDSDIDSASEALALVDLSAADTGGGEANAQH